MGRRLSRTYGSTTTTYVWDGAHIIAEYDNGSLTKKYIYGPGMDNPVAMINVSGETEIWYYYFADAQGSVRLWGEFFFDQPSLYEASARQAGLTGFTGFFRTTTEWAEFHGNCLDCG